MSPSLVRVPPFVRSFVCLDADAALTFSACSDVRANGGTLCHYHVQRTVDSAEASRSKRQPLPPNPTRLPSSAPSYIVDHLGVGAVSPQNSVLQHSVLVLPDNYLVFVPGPGDNIVKLRSDVIASWNGQPTPRPSTGDWVTKDTPAVIERSTVSPPTSTFEDCVSEYLHGSLVAVASTGECTIDCGVDQIANGANSALYSHAVPSPALFHLDTTQWRSGRGYY